MTADKLINFLRYATLVMLPLPVFAHELETRITVSAEYTDNSLLEQEQEIIELLRTPTIDIDYLYEFSSFTADLSYSFKRQDYREDSFPDRTDVVGEGSLLWSVVENRVTWSFFHNENRISLRNELPGTPSNEDDRTVWSTGPSINLISGAKSRLTLDGAYMESNSENFIDAEMVRAQIRYFQKFSELFGAGVFVMASEINTESSFVDNDTQSAGIDLSMTREKLNIQLRYGRNTADRESGDENSGPLLNASLDWVSSQRKISIKANRELTDSNFGLSLNSNITDPLDNGDGNVRNEDVIERSRHEFSYTELFARGQLNMTYIYDDQNSEQLVDTETTRTASLRYEYPLNRRMNVSYEYRHETRKFTQADAVEDELTTKTHTLGVRYSLNNSWDLQLDLEDETRKSDQGVAGEYDVFTAILKISYRI